ncbi:hypothetical protein V6N13_132400 [Hibiscus sabdariffa]|uniref:Uncharacterized protein n=1 Tax=Hibiscus sabdariffa TaxID=183260 RepID=A0ABR2PV72_9ROSI
MAKTSDKFRETFNNGCLSLLVPIGTIATLRTEIRIVDPSLIVLTIIQLHSLESLFFITAVVTQSVDSFQFEGTNADSDTVVLSIVELLGMTLLLRLKRPRF